MDLMELPIIVVVGEREVVGVVVKQYLRTGIKGRGDRLVVRHRLPFVALCPVVAVGGETEHELVVGNILRRPVGGTLHPVLRGDGAGLALTVVLVVSHEEEVIVVTGEGLYVVVLVEWCDVLRDVHIVVVEEHREFLYEIGQ